MPVNRCPACNVPLTHDEAKGSMCPACGAALAGRAAAEASPRDERLPAPFASRIEACDLCKTAQPGVSRCYLKVIGQSLNVTGSVRQRWVNVQCTCCPACFRKGRSLQTLRYAALGMMLGFPALLCGGLGLLAEPLQQRAGVPRGVIDGLVLTTLALCAMIWFLSPFYIRFATRRRLRDLLSPALDERLRALVGVRGWGWRHYVTAVTDVPERESFTDLRAI